MQGILDWLASLPPVILYIVMFAISAVGYRGAILSLGLPSFVLAATFTVTVGLLMQAGLLTLYLALRDRAVPSTQSNGPPRTISLPPNFLKIGPLAAM